jgi:TATA-binding protein-associated factor
LSDGFSSKSCLQKFLSATVIEEWVRAVDQDAIVAKPPFHERDPLAERLASSLVAILESPPPAAYTETDLVFDRLFAQCLGLYHTFQQRGKVPPAKIPTLVRDGFTLNRAQKVVTEDFDALVANIGRGLKKGVLPELEEHRKKVITDIGLLQESKERQDVLLMAAVGAAVIVLGAIPMKLNPLIRSVMNSIKVRCCLMFVGLSTSLTAVW